MAYHDHLDDPNDPINRENQAGASERERSSSRHAWAFSVVFAVAVAGAVLIYWTATQVDVQQAAQPGYATTGSGNSAGN